MSADAYTQFREELFSSGFLVPTGVDGVYLRSGSFERIVEGINRLVSAEVPEGTPALHPPLLVSRKLLEQTDYLRSFPDLAGVVSNFAGGDAEHAALLGDLDAGEDWSGRLEPTDLALCSAACHPLYPTLSAPLPAAGSRYEVFGQCFRHEPSIDPARMQAFRQHEVVYVGSPEGARAHREEWIERGLRILAGLGLEVEAVVANDPFFGRNGRLLAASQRSEALKIEIISPICSREAPTAITSSNCHLDHFGAAFGLSLDDGTVAHSACVGFGLERITLALLHTHGLEPASWPDDVRRALGL